MVWHDPCRPLPKVRLVRVRSPESSNRGARHAREGALGPGTDGRKPSPPGPRWRTNLGAPTADLGPIVLLPAFQMGYFIRSTGHVEPLLLRLALLGAEDSHQNLGHVAPPACSPRPRTLERTARAVTGKGRSSWLRQPGSRNLRTTTAGPAPTA